MSTNGLVHYISSQPHPIRSMWIFLKKVSKNLIDIKLNTQPSINLINGNKYRILVPYPKNYSLSIEYFQMSDITSDVPHLIINKLKPGADYKFRFTPILRGTAPTSDVTSAQLSLVLDVKMPSTRKGKCLLKRYSFILSNFEFVFFYSGEK